jgi:hypothetical protein
MQESGCNGPDADAPEGRVADAAINKGYLASDLLGRDAIEVA